MRCFFVPACLERRKGGGKSIPRSVKLIVSHILTYSNNKLAVSLLQKINISCKLISKHDNGLARRDAGLTQEKLAEKIGVSTVFVSQLESGSRAPGLETLVKLSQTLHVSLDLLVLGGAPGGDAEACLAALVQGRSPRQRMLAVSLVRSLFAEMDRLDAEPPEC